MTTTTAGSTIIPALRYQDALAAIDWLCRVFGFARRAVYTADNNIVMHAELTLGNGMIMLGSIDNKTPYSGLIRQPKEVGFETQSPYIIVEDCTAVYERAKAAGAEIVMELEEKSYGGKGFNCRDLEGHMWSIGEFNPWATEPR